MLTSLTSEDDPAWEQGSAGNDSQEWYDAADSEYDNLCRFEVFRLVPADEVPSDVRRGHLRLNVVVTHIQGEARTG